MYTSYTVVRDEGDVLHLTESKARRAFLFFFFRVMPFILGALVFAVYFKAGDELPVILRVPLVALGLIVALLLLTRKVLYAIIITPQKITLTYGGWGQNTRRDILTADVLHIQSIVDRSRAGGIFFDAVLKNGGKERILTIPIFYMDDKYREPIGRRLASITGLEVKNV